LTPPDAWLDFDYVGTSTGTQSQPWKTFADIKNNTAYNAVIAIKDNTYTGKTFDFYLLDNCWDSRTFKAQTTHGVIIRSANIGAGTALFYQRALQLTNGTVTFDGIIFEDNNGLPIFTGVNNVFPYTYYFNNCKFLTNATVGSIHPIFYEQGNNQALFKFDSCFFYWNKTTALYAVAFQLNQAGIRLEMNHCTLVGGANINIDYATYGLINCTYSTIRNTIMVDYSNILTKFLYSDTANLVHSNNNYWRADGTIIKPVTSPGTNIITQNPLFVSATGLSTDNYALRPSSPCKNLGTV
jgi:hypothetical protein